MDTAQKTKGRDEPLKITGLSKTPAHRGAACSSSVPPDPPLSLPLALLLNIPW